MAQPLHVGAPVLAVVLPGEVVVGGEVDEPVGAPGPLDLLEDRGDGRPVADVRLVPGDVRVHRGPGAGLGAAGEADDAMVLLQLLEQVTPDEAGGPGDDEAREGHGSPTTTASSVSSKWTDRRGRFGGPATGCPVGVERAAVAPAEIARLLFAPTQPAPEVSAQEAPGDDPRVGPEKLHRGAVVLQAEAPPADLGQGHAHPAVGWLRRPARSGQRGAQAGSEKGQRPPADTRAGISRGPGRTHAAPWPPGPASSRPRARRRRTTARPINPSATPERGTTQGTVSSTLVIRRKITATDLVMTRRSTPR